MLNFFRRIRRKLANQNKFIQYSRYAIGEIVLVVIGILIALQINNWNESKTQEKKIIEALKEIHSELSGDIQESNDVIEYYKLGDSLINVIMTKELSAEDYIGINGFKYAYAGAGFEDLTIENNGFELLMSNSNNIPPKYQALVKSLKKIYVEGQMELDKSLEMTLDAIESDYSYLKKNTNWYYDFSYHRRLTIDAVDFYLNDPYFKNSLSHFHLFAIGNYYRFVYEFRLDAEDTYEELTSILELEDLKASDSTFYKVNVKDYEHFLGTYKDSVNTVVISTESDRLFYQLNDNKKAKLFPTSLNSFVQGDNLAFNTIELDSTGQVLSYVMRIGNRQHFMKKID